MSSEHGIIKIATEKEAKWKIEWTIEDIYSCSQEYGDYDSPCFTVPGSKWYLKMRMFCSAQSDAESHSDNNSGSWISLYLCPAEYPKYPITVDYTFGWKKADGTVENIISYRYDFNDEKPRGLTKFLERSELLQKKSKLVSSDDLTVICLIEVKDKFNYTSRLIKLAESFEDLLASKEFCDVTLKIQNEEFPAHKCILATRSSVFAVMLKADMKEKNTGIVDIQDCDPTAFKDFLTFLYSGKSHITLDNVFNLYRIVHKYDVEELKADCVLFILNNLSVENFCDAVVLAEQFDEEGIKSKTRAFFIENFQDIVYTAKWELFLKKNWRLTNELFKSLAEDVKSKKRKLK